MTQLSTKYNPSETEDKWYDIWMKNKFFSSRPNPDKEPYTIVIPPPNVTGVLHMGHMLNNTIQDVLIRKARMQGYEACWVPGTDHASIATETKVVAMLKEKGIDKNDISREEFLKHAWEWKEKYGGIILEQLKKLGASCDWDRERFTMEPKLTRSVIHTFVDLYNHGYIYRGVRMVNWDPRGRTALSDDEVIYKEVQSKLYYIRYPIEGETGHITIATTRPETILGDTAVCVNPADERYRHLRGKRVLVPLINRSVPVIEDDYVSMDFGTGCLKITPAHDENDYEIGMRHHLETIDILNDDGTLSEKAGLYIGEDREVVREKISRELKEKGYLVKVEDYVNKVGFSERTDVPIEPKLSTQWFLKMDEITKPALKNVMDDTIRLVPPKFKNMYRSWMENVRDWCISRQLWWGQRIPAWYLPDGDYVVAENEEKALLLAREKTGDKSLKTADLRQDEDVLDTWFSSWLWPITVFDGIIDPDNEDFKYYYPTSVLVTGWDIIFFWVARMIIAGYYITGKYPFKEVYFTGMVRDAQRRKMSKSLGNSPEPLELIARYGADGVRTGMLFSAAAGNDLLFDTKLCEQGRNFSNKIWNALRLVKSWKVSDEAGDAVNDTAVRWFESHFHASLAEVEDLFDKYRISEALMLIYKLIWDDYCSWYLEIVKPAYGQPIDRPTYDKTIGFFENLMKVLHPFMPFITEEVWHRLRDREQSDCIMVSRWPEKGSVDASLSSKARQAFDVISGVRNIRNAKQIPVKKVLQLQVISKHPGVYREFEGVIKKMANLDSLILSDEKIPGAAGFMVGTDECFIPLDQHIDRDKEIENIQKEIAYTEGFLKSVTKKLDNERFVNNAPEKVVAMEQKKKEDAEHKLKALKEKLSHFKK